MRTNGTAAAAAIKVTPELRKAKVYSVQTNDGEAPVYYGTKREAMASARKAAADATMDPTDVEVEVVTLVPLDKAAILRLINVSGGFVEESKTIKVFKRRRNGGAQ